MEPTFKVPGFIKKPPCITAQEFNLLFNHFLLAMYLTTRLQANY